MTKLYTRDKRVIDLMEVEAYEYISSIWTYEPDDLIDDPVVQKESPGLTYGCHGILFRYCFHSPPGPEGESRLAYDTKGYDCKEARDDAYRWFLKLQNKHFRQRVKKRTEANRQRRIELGLERVRPIQHEPTNESQIEQVVKAPPPQVPTEHVPAKQTEQTGEKQPAQSDSHSWRFWRWLLKPLRDRAWGRTR